LALKPIARGTCLCKSITLLGDFYELLTFAVLKKSLGMLKAT
jgi:hypothetical protein